MGDKSEKHSPVISKKKQELDFPTALRAVIAGKRITKLEWNDKMIYGYLKNAFLTLHKDGKDFTWSVSEGDLIGLDWIILPALN